MENAVLNSQPNMVKTSITYGLLIGVLLILILFVFYLFGEITNVWASYVSYAVMFGGIILATRARRNEELGGFITYSQALGLGTLTIFFSSLAVGIYVYIFYAFIDPAAINLLIEAAEIAILESTPNISDEELDSALSISQAFMKPGIMAISTTASYTFLGFVMSLITSIFLKKKNPELF